MVVPDGLRSVHERPTIKGTFVNSHVKAVRRALGDAGVDELERRLGHPVDYGEFQDVLVADEVRLIEHALELLHGPVSDPEARAFEAGRLHYRNFKTTPWAKIIFSLFPANFRFFMRRSPTVAERVFRGVGFEARDIDAHTLLIRMTDPDYPIEHFRGLFTEWMDDFGEHGEVIAQETPDGGYDYVIRLEPS